MAAAMPDVLGDPYSAIMAMPLADALVANLDAIAVANARREAIENA